MEPKIGKIEGQCFTCKNRRSSNCPILKEKPYFKNPLPNGLTMLISFSSNSLDIRILHCHKYDEEENVPSA